VGGAWAAEARGAILGSEMIPPTAADLCYLVSDW
jgi:hypothetical protein